MNRLLVCAALAALGVGCAGRIPTARPPVTPPGSETPQGAARAPRIAVVDLARAARAHPRWPEVQAIDRQIGDLEAKIASVVEARPAPARIDLPKVDLTPEMKTAVERMRPEFQQEAEAVKAAGRKELDAYVAQLRAEQQKQIQAKQAELEAQLAKAYREKQQALDKDNQQYQQQVLAEYRLPLLNLKLKIENVQQSNKGDADKLSQQMQALAKERDDKIAAHEKANQQTLQDFQKEQVQAGNAQLRAYQDELSKDGQRLVDQRAAQVTERMRAQFEAKQAELNQRLRKQQQTIVAAARDTQTQEVEKVKTAVMRQAQAEITKLQTLRVERQAAQRGRARLYAVILADLRIETAALAQEKGWDVVLTNTIAAPGFIDATDELIARLKR